MDINKSLINNTLPIHKIVSLGGMGWYRIAKIECSSISSVTGGMGNSCDIEINRSYNNTSTEFKKIQLVSIYQSSKFTNEISQGSQLITKIRHTVDSENKVGYIEIYYNSDKANGHLITLTNYMNVNRKKWELIEPEQTAETVDGVSVLGSHDFSLNYDMQTQINNIKTSGYITIVNSKCLSSTSAQSIAITNYMNYNALYIIISTDANNGNSIYIPRAFLKSQIPFSIEGNNKNDGGYSMKVQGYYSNGVLTISYSKITGWENFTVHVCGLA